MCHYFESYKLYWRSFKWRNQNLEENCPDRSLAPTFMAFHEQSNPNHFGRHRVAAKHAWPCCYCFFGESLQDPKEISYSPEEHREPSRSRPSSTDPHRPIHSEPAALIELQPVYSNVSPGHDNLVYSQIWSSHHTKENPGETASEQVEEPAIIYSEVKKAHPDDHEGQAHEDAAENYENLPCVPLALDH
ncbi:hypothetical protein GH733_010426 [Mirounga leonina]|nr:hypothetical protein GH733_010426 [Mirounga leonina]